MNLTGLIQLKEKIAVSADFDAGQRDFVLEAINSVVEHAQIKRSDIKVIVASANRIIEVMRGRMSESSSRRESGFFRDVSIEAATILKLLERHKL